MIKKEEIEMRDIFFVVIIFILFDFFLKLFLLVYLLKKFNLILI